MSHLSTWSNQSHEHHHEAQRDPLKPEQTLGIRSLIQVRECSLTFNPVEHIGAIRVTEE